MASGAAPEAAVLLIGSTGNGKSTLGNRLLDPHEEREFPIFETATSNMPKTASTQAETRVLRNVGKHKQAKLTVIDTPGLNEGSREDVRHMIGLIEQLSRLTRISACIFVVKFNSTIDSQYRATIEYYARLLPSLFDKNVFVVMTNYATDQRSVLLREKQGLNEKEIQGNVVKTIVECADLCFSELITFKIDCLPVMDEEKQASLDTCISMIDYILSLDPVRISRLRVAKTDFLMVEDDKKRKEYEGMITGYKERIEEVNSEAKAILDKIHIEEQSVTELKAQVQSANETLKEKDTDDLVTAEVWSIDQEWKWFKTQKAGYHIESPWQICNVKEWTNGKCRLVHQQQTSQTLKGIATGRFMHGLYANITLETKKRLKYANEIREARDSLRKGSDKLTTKCQVLSEMSGKYENCCSLVETFKKFIDEKRKLILQLSSDKMGMEEACERLRKLN